LAASLNFSSASLFAGVQVGVVLFGQPVIRLLDVRGARITGYPEDFVQIAHVGKNRALRNAPTTACQGTR
jgi:hypothetical protein